MGGLSALSLLLAAASVAAFEIPLTSSQRAQKLVEQGYERIVRGDYAGAISACDRALEVRDDWAPAYVCRSEAKLWLKDPKSDRDARRAMRFDPNSGDPYRLLGLWEFEAKRYGAAIVNFSRALELSKLKPEGITECYFYRARSRIHTGDFKGALTDIEQGLGVLQGVNGSYGDWSFHTLRAELRRRFAQWNGADADEREVLARIEERLRQHPAERSELLLRRAHSRALLGLYADAADDYAKIFTLVKSPDPRLYLEQAVVLVMDGRPKTALVQLEQVSGRGPNPPMALRMSILLHAVLGDSAKTAADLQALRALADRSNESDWNPAPVEDGASWIEGGEADKARPPSDKSLWGRQALAFELRMQHSAALTAAASALALDPEDAAARVAQAQAAIEAGRCAEGGASIDWIARRLGAAHPYPAHLRSLCAPSAQRSQPPLGPKAGHP